MKTLKFLFALSMLFAFSACEDEKKDEPKSIAPQEVMDKFSAEYPNATDVEWESEGVNFGVEFEWEGKEYEIVYDPNGSLLYTESSSDVGSLPDGVTAYIDTMYVGSTIEEVVEISRDGNTLYEVEIVFDEMGKELVFKSDGTPVGEDTYVEDEDDEEDDDDGEE